MIVLGAIAKFAVPKGFVMGPFVLWVVQAGLGPFLEALIIAIVSATITALGMVYAARIREQEMLALRQQTSTNTEHLEDVKEKLGIDQRRGDPGQ